MAGQPRGTIRYITVPHPHHLKGNYFHTLYGFLPYTVSDANVHATRTVSKGLVAGRSSRLTCQAVM